MNYTNEIERNREDPYFKLRSIEVLKEFVKFV